jgi:hypothetical protein
MLLYNVTNILYFVIVVVLHNIIVHLCIIFYNKRITKETT